MKHFLFSSLLMVVSCSVLSSEMIYQPINPNFGGSPLNASGLLANAQAQNDTKSSTGYVPKTALERFTDSVESRAFSMLFNDSFDNGNSGSLSTDDFVVDLINVDGVLTITITDVHTGEVTEIVVSGLPITDNQTGLEF